jgi:hypothetical protein
MADDKGPDEKSNLCFQFQINLEFINDLSDMNPHY